MLSQLILAIKKYEESGESVCSMLDYWLEITISEFILK